MLWALADHQGSVKMLLDNEGNVVNEITYDAFGNVTVETNPDINFRFSYTGRELDPETGLYNYRTRYLDPRTHQFISPDTIGFAGGDTNLYRYVANSPLNYIDPFGLFKFNFPRPAPTGTGTGAGMGTGAGGGTAPTIGVPTIDRRDLYILNEEELKRKKEYIEKNGSFSGSDNPNLWRVDPEQLPKPYRQPTCITAPGASCDVPDENEDFAERVRRAIEEIDRQNQERQQDEDNNQGDSCGIGDRPDFLDDIVDSSEPTEGNSNDTNNPAGDFHDSQRPLTQEEALSQGLDIFNREQIISDDIRGAYPSPGGTTGHATKHKFPKDLQAEIINNPERTFAGINDNGRQVSIFYKDQNVVITQNNDHRRVITAYGKDGTGRNARGKEVPGKPVDPGKWANNSNYVEISGSRNPSESRPIILGN